MKRNSFAPLLEEWGQGEPAALERARRARVAAGLGVKDFITARPHDHGFRFDENLLRRAMLEAAAGAVQEGYGAETAGWMPAREAVAAWHGGRARAMDVLLTPGTSLAYYYLFRLLARPQAEVLCPAPSYPLFDDIARLAGVRVRHYHLHETAKPDGGTRWALEGDELNFQVTPHTVAIVVVDPHNPTGTVMSGEEMGLVAEAARRAGVPVITDEVFRWYGLDGLGPKRWTPPEDVPWITLDGLSKSHYLPGLKGGWIVVEGRGELADRLRHGLEYVSDTFLPVSDGVQRALPVLLGSEGRGEVERLAALMRARMELRLDAAVREGVKVDRPEAGPYVCVPLPPGTDEEALAVKLVERGGAVFHPGRLYGMPEPCLVATVFNGEDWPGFVACLG